MAKITSWRKI